MGEIEPNVRKADQLLEGAERILSRQPESGYQLDDSSVWFIAGRTVDICIFYTFDDNHVYFLSAKIFSPPEL